MVTAEEQTKADLEVLKQVAAQQDEPTPEPVPVRQEEPPQYIIPDWVMYCLPKGASLGRWRKALVIEFNVPSQTATLHVHVARKDKLGTLLIERKAKLGTRPGDFLPPEHFEAYATAMMAAVQQQQTQAEPAEPEPEEGMLSTSGVVLGSEGGEVVLTPDAGNNAGGEWTGDEDSGEEDGNAE